MKINETLKNNSLIKHYYWEPIIKEACIMEEEDLDVIIGEVPPYYSNIKKILSEIKIERFH